MGEAIGQTLPLAVGVALSPIGIVAVVVMLTTGKGGANGLAFLLGWFAGLMIFGGLLLLLNRGADASSGGQPADWTSYGKILLGFVLLLMARRQWQKKPAKGEDAEMPKWMEKVDTFTPVRTIGVAVALSALNPKNLVLTLAAATAIAQTGSTTGDQTIALFTYSLIASLGTAIPVGIYFFMGDRASDLLARLRESMARNGGVIMAVICLVIAAKLIGDGVSTLSLS